MINVQKLKSRMVLAGYTQLSLAAEAGISINALNAKLNGRSRIYVDEASKICDILNITQDSDKCEIFLPCSSQ